MSTISDSSVSVTQTGTRSDEMHSTIEHWVDDLVASVGDAQASEEFQERLDVQSRFHDYSYRNTLLIKRQCPEATRVAGYRTWQEEFDRHVQKGESAIWIWAPIIMAQCPECENSPSYHEEGDCESDKTPPEEWSEGLVGFKFTLVFDIVQTEGKADHLPTDWMPIDGMTVCHGSDEAMLDSWGSSEDWWEIVPRGVHGRYRRMESHRVVGNAVAVFDECMDLSWCPRLAVFEECTNFVPLCWCKLRRPPAAEAWA